MNFFNDIAVDLDATIGLGRTRTFRFTANVRVADLFSQPSIANIMQQAGAMIPALGDSAMNVCNSVGLTAVCNGYTSFKNFLANPGAANGNGFSIGLTFNGDLSTQGCQTFSASLSLQLGNMPLGPYSLSYSPCDIPSIPKGSVPSVTLPAAGSLPKSKAMIDQLMALLPSIQADLKAKVMSALQAGLGQAAQQMLADCAAGAGPLAALAPGCKLVKEGMMFGGQALKMLDLKVPANCVGTCVSFTVDLNAGLAP